MADKEWRIAPMGDRGLVIELGRSINPVTNRTVPAIEPAPNNVPCGPRRISTRSRS